MTPTTSCFSRDWVWHRPSCCPTWLDGRPLFADITLGHSHGHRFYAIPDGSFVLVEDGAETLFGEGWRIEDGAMNLFCRAGESRRL